MKARGYCRMLLRACPIVLCIFIVAAVQSDITGLMIWLPGTQPGQVSEAESFRNCTQCHADIVRDWLGSAKAHAPRDPVFNAFLAVTTKRTLHLGLDVPEYCLRCHSPSGWLAGRSHELSVQALFGTDLDGVHCDFCHRSVDPVTPDSGASYAGQVPGYGNGMYVVMPQGNPRRGPRVSSPEGHPTFYDPFLKTSEFCGVCHEVSNPYLSDNPARTPPHRQVPLERTYSEWRASWYATQGEAGSCQSCHMPRTQGNASSLPGARLRLDLAQHDFTGGNTFVPRVLNGFWGGVDTSALARGELRARSTLRSAASLEVAAGRTGGGVVALVRVINLSGHKLPTGFPEGRRMWLSVKGKGDGGSILFESGTYSTESGEILRDPQVKVYEAKIGLSASVAAFAGLPEGPSFHAALSDTVYFDNRIPPRGFVSATFRERRAAPVGYDYAEGQFWDVSRYVMPADVTSVEVCLLYQLVSKELAEFLRDENTGNPYDWNNWGQQVFEAWRSHGGPVVIAEQQSSVQNSEPALPPVRTRENPVRFVLAQNYPNPFNAETTIEFWLSTGTNVNLSVYALTGERVRTLAASFVGAGLSIERVDASGLSSGVYLYRLVAGEATQTRKMIVLK